MALMPDRIGKLAHDLANGQGGSFEDWYYVVEHVYLDNVDMKEAAIEQLISEWWEDEKSPNGSIFRHGDNWPERMWTAVRSYRHGRVLLATMYLRLKK